MCTKQFTKRTFTFLQQVNENRRLLAIDLKVAVTLIRYFNENDNGGRAYPSIETLATAAGVGEATVIRSVRRMECNGHLRIVWGKPGRGHPNQYWMIIKPPPVEVLDAEKAPSQAARKAPSVKIKAPPVEENLFKNHKGLTPLRAPRR